MEFSLVENNKETYEDGNFCFCFGSPQTETKTEIQQQFIWKQFTCVMIPGSKVGSRETETGDGEKPREGGQMAIITVDAYGLILPESLRIACGKDGTL